MFEKTFDEQKINRAVLAGLNSPALSREKVEKLYGVPAGKMQRYLIPLANAIKFSYPRRHPSGDFLDTDLYGAQQHRPLIQLEL